MSDIDEALEALDVLHYAKGDKFRKNVDKIRQALERQRVPLAGYRETMWAEQSPDVYDGENCDEVRPRWNAFAEGDKDSDYSDDLKLDARHFPAGTKVVVMEPECPLCQQTPSLCRGSEWCDFDWDDWVAGQYS